MFLLLIFGKEFGFSANLRTMCAIGGGGQLSDFFKFDWKSQVWNLVFAVGAIMGGYIAHEYMMPSEKIALNPKTIEELENYGTHNAGDQYLPPEMFTREFLSTWQGLVIMIGGGFLIGFGTRYAGLSNLQWPSLLAVIGFFIGGLITTYFILPFLLPG
ncbi:MAG: YeeE/YedE family protein [Flavobacteriales bacterium]|nr:YeeE/YedE family protein [Flavobacteriales bacterium]